MSQILKNDKEYISSFITRSSHIKSRALDVYKARVAIQTLERVRYTRRILIFAHSRLGQDYNRQT